jgi:hypothetical protein
VGSLPAHPRLCRLANAIAEVPFFLRYSGVFGGDMVLLEVFVWLRDSDGHLWVCCQVKDDFEMSEAVNKFNYSWWFLCFWQGLKCQFMASVFMCLRAKLE